MRSCLVWKWVRYHQQLFPDNLSLFFERNNAVTFFCCCLLQISEAKSEEINFSEIKVFFGEKRQASRHRHICSSETDNCLSEIFRMNFDISLKWKSFLNYINTKILISSKVVNSDPKSITLPLLPRISHPYLTWPYQVVFPYEYPYRPC